MKIGWIQGIQNWAFRIICRHYQEAIPECQHINLEFDDKEGKADVLYVVWPPIIKGIKDKSKVILHLDSERTFYEDTM